MCTVVCEYSEYRRIDHRCYFGTILFCLVKINFNIYAVSKDLFVNLIQKNLLFTFLLSVILFPDLYAAQAQSHGTASSSSAQSQTSNTMRSHVIAIKEQDVQSKSNKVCEEAIQEALGIILYERGKKYDSQKDANTAIGYYLAAAEIGNIDANYELGMIYYNGDGVTQDFYRAREYFERAADKGDADALYMLACMCLKGQGAEPNDIMGREYLRGAAERGHQDALTCLRACECYELGRKYLEGWSVSKDVKRACDYLEQAVNKATAQGDGSIIFAVGRIYEKGQFGLKKDFKRACAYFQRAAELGDEDACFRLGMILHDGEGVERDLKKAFAYFKQVTEKKFSARHSDAFYMLGYMCYYGELGAVDLKQTFEYLQSSIEFNRYNSRALCLLGRMYHWGEYVSRDYSRALEYYAGAAYPGYHPDASYELGCNLHDGPHNRSDDERAFNYFQVAEKGGNVSALYRLGRMCWDGIGTKYDVKGALCYFENAANKGNVEALCFLSDLYLNGDEYRRIAKDINKSRQYREQAIKQEAILRTAVTLRRETFRIFADWYHLGIGVQKNLAQALAYYLPAAQLGDKRAMEVFCKAWKKNLLPKTRENQRFYEELLKKYSEDYFIGMSSESKFLAEESDEESESDGDDRKEERKVRRSTRVLKIEREENQEACNEINTCKLHLHNGISVYCAEEQCAICFERLDRLQSISILSCCHMFCPACLTQWFESKPGICPLCKRGKKERFEGIVKPSE